MHAAKLAMKQINQACVDDQIFMDDLMMKSWKCAQRMLIDLNTPKESNQDDLVYKQNADEANASYTVLFSIAHWSCVWQR
jgi:hypothetical protein